VGRADGVLASRAANDATRASSWVSIAEKGRSAGSGAGEQGLRGWCRVRWSPELFRCWNSAVGFFVSPTSVGADLKFTATVLKAATFFLLSYNF
jgi:hypothetical protein